MTIFEKYKRAKKFTKTCAEQKALFSWWKSLKNKPCIGADTETTGLKFGLPTYLAIQGHRKTDPIVVKEMKDVVVFGLSLAIEKAGVVYLFWGRYGSPLFRDILDVLKVRGRKAIHNARYDIRACEVSKIKLAGPIDCTYTMSRIYWDRRRKHSLQKLCEILCPELSDWETVIDKEMSRLRREYKALGYDTDYVNYSFIPDETMGKYSLIDAFMGLMVYQYLEPKISNDFHELYEREMKVLHIIKDVEKVGLRFDIPRAERQLKLLNTRIGSCLRKMFDIAGTHNPNSPAQVLAFLRASGVKRKALTLKGKVTTGADVIRRVARELPPKHKKVKKYIDTLLEYKSYTKTTGTYLKPFIRRALQTGGIIYCQINPADTVTGRMESRDPNLQNVPEPIKRKTGKANPVRSCFICRIGCWNYYADYSQMEVVIFGVYANEHRILEPYADGEDIHGNMASYVYGADYSERQRDLVKNVTYGKIYGIGVNTMSLMYDMTTEEARDVLAEYEREFPCIKEFQYACKDELRTYGYVTDWFGKRYHVPLGKAYVAVNCLVQGGCASIFKLALLNVKKLMDGKTARLLLPVHDEFQIERQSLEGYDPEREKIFTSKIVEAMVDIPEVLDRGLRLRVDVSRTKTNWAEKEKIAV